MQGTIDVERCLKKGSGSYGTTFRLDQEKPEVHFRVEVRPEILGPRRRQVLWAQYQTPHPTWAPVGDLVPADDSGTYDVAYMGKTYRLTFAEGEKYIEVRSQEVAK